jgi:hypothetical protein
MFNKSHIQGYYGIKAKYLQKASARVTDETSFNTSFYRS